jgi:twinfilin-like protein
MVYSTTRNTLTKSLGSSLFTGSPEVSTRTGFVSAYNEYIKIKADKSAAPLNAMEREMADIRAAEREAQAGGGGGAFAGMSARQNHLGTMVGLGWGEEVEEAVRELGAGDGSRVVVIVSTMEYIEVVKFDELTWV